MNDCKDCIQKCIHRKWGHICEYYATARDRVIRLKEEENEATLQRPNDQCNGIG